MKQSLAVRFVFSNLPKIKRFPSSRNLNDCVSKQWETAIWTKSAHNLKGCMTAKIYFSKAGTFGPEINAKAQGEYLSLS